MNENILLVEPDYKTKYPPLGLMKLATYHKVIRKDNIKFIRGCNKYILEEQWDRIYISTLFTYTWEKTVETINFYKKLGKDDIFENGSYAKKIYVGGILATLMTEELYNATGVSNIVKGLLTTPKQIGIYDDKKNTNIDKLPPDYSIIEKINAKGKFVYTHANDYLGYATRGCVRRCEFCAVWKIEPEYIPYVSVLDMNKKVIRFSGVEKQNLILMDNNVTASRRFDDIIDDIKRAGFIKGATFGPTRRKRIVDFNQGLDARLLTEKKMQRLSEIPLEPMRIAFDDINEKTTYINVVRLAHKYGQKNMSNYVLYNYKDSPKDFYERLEINIKLNEEFKNNGSGIKTVIYSFPMRYIPLNAKDRNIDTGNKNWNEKYLRAIKIILNVTKGPVMPGPDFFYQAFGINYEYFKAILLMPEEFIRKRLIRNWKKYNDLKKQWTPYVREWIETYMALDTKEREKLIEILKANNYEIVEQEYRRKQSKKISTLLKNYMNALDIVEEYNK